MSFDESDESDEEKSDGLESEYGSPGTIGTIGTGLVGLFSSVGIPLGVMISMDESCDGDGGLISVT